VLWVCQYYLHHPQENCSIWNELIVLLKGATIRCTQIAFGPIQKGLPLTYASTDQVCGRLYPIKPRNSTGLFWKMVKIVDNEMASGLDRINNAVHETSILATNSSFTPPICPHQKQTKVIQHPHQKLTQQSQLLQSSY
jgi:hypothetical protein